MEVVEAVTVEAADSEAAGPDKVADKAGDKAVDEVAVVVAHLGKASLCRWRRTRLEWVAMYICKLS